MVIQFDMIYDMIRYDIYDMIYLLNAIARPPRGSSTVHIDTQTINRTTQNKQYIEQHKNKQYIEQHKNKQYIEQHKNKQYIEQHKISNT